MNKLSTMWRYLPSRMSANECIRTSCSGSTLSLLTIWLGCSNCSAMSSRPLEPGTNGSLATPKLKKGSCCTPHTNTHKKPQPTLGHKKGICKTWKALSQWTGRWLLKEQLGSDLSWAHWKRRKRGKEGRQINAGVTNVRRQLWTPPRRGY